MIREARASSNAAIAKHDVAGVVAIMLPEYVAVSSTNARTVGRDSTQARYAQIFGSRPDLKYVRTPDEIIVNTTWGQAAERGHWTGKWTQSDGVTSIGGTYFAKWRKVDDKWRLIAEVFVQTECSGSGYCAPSSQVPATR